MYYILFAISSKDKIIIIYLIFLHQIINTAVAQMLHNVPAVYDVFLRPIRKNAKHFYGRKKMWRNKNAQRAQARLCFCVARAAEGGEAYTDLLGEVKIAFILFFMV